MENANKISLKAENTGAMILVLVLSILNIALFVSQIIAETAFSFNQVLRILTIIMSLATIYYVATGYNVPHGNGFKYLCLAFAIYVAITLAVKTLFGTDTLLGVEVVTDLITVLAVPYMAGRLHKFKKNVVIIFIVAAAAIVYGIAQAIIFGKTPATVCGSFGKLLMWAAIAIAYVARFNAHKEAGLKDKEENN